jgi:hypothetical protein
MTPVQRRAGDYVLVSGQIEAQDTVLQLLWSGSMNHRKGRGPARRQDEVDELAVQEALWRRGEDGVGRCVWINWARAKALGLSHPDEAIGLTVAELNGRPPTPMMQQLAQAVRDGHPPSAETVTWYINRVTGERHWVFMVSMPDIVNGEPLLHTYCWPMLAPDVLPEAPPDALPRNPQLPTSVGQWDVLEGQLAKHMREIARGEIQNALLDLGDTVVSLKREDQPDRHHGGAKRKYPDPEEVAAQVAEYVATAEHFMGFTIPELCAALDPPLSRNQLGVYLVRAGRMRKPEKGKRGDSLKATCVRLGRERVSRMAEMSQLPST